MKKKINLDSKLRFETETLRSLHAETLDGVAGGAAGISLAIGCQLPTRVTCLLCIPNKNGGQ